MLLTAESVSISTANQIRYFKFTPNTPGTYTIASTDNGSSDPYGYLYSFDGAQLAYNDDGAGSKNFKMEYILNAGTQYFIGVKMYSTGTGSFMLSITPPNNTSLANAAPITIEVPSNVSINTASQMRYFSFTPSAAGTYIMTSTENGSSDPYG